MNTAPMTVPLTRSQSNPSGRMTYVLGEIAFPEGGAAYRACSGYREATSSPVEQPVEDSGSAPTEPFFVEDVSGLTP